MAWFFDEDQALRCPFAIRGVEVVGGQEEAHGAARLVADRGALLAGGRLRELQPGAVGAWSHHHPAFAVAHVGVLHEGEAERADVVIDGPVVVVDHDCGQVKAQHR